MMDMPKLIWLQDSPDSHGAMGGCYNLYDDGRQNVTYTRTDLAESLADALERMVNHVAILPPEMDQPGSVMAQARAALKRYRGE